MWKNNTIWLPRRRKKNDKIHVISVPFTNEHICPICLIIITNRERQKKYLSTVLAMLHHLVLEQVTWLFCLTTPEDGVLRCTPAHLFQRTQWFLFCLFGVEGVKRTAESSPPLVSQCQQKPWVITRDFCTYYICAKVSNKRTCWCVYRSKKSTKQNRTELYWNLHTSHATHRGR